MKKLLGFAILLAIAGMLYAGDRSDLTIPELQAAIAAGKVILVDANGTKSWQAGHIAGAIDFKANEGKLGSLLPKDKTALVVAYCGGPKCLAYRAAVAAAQKLGYTNVKHLPDGIKGWVAAGAPTEKGS